jgi:hypothetical protein
MSRCQKAGQRQSIKIANRSLKVWLRSNTYLGKTLTDQNYMQEEIKSRRNSGNACYHSVQSLLSSLLPSRNVKVKIYKTIILPVVLYGCGTLSLTLMEGVQEYLDLRWMSNRRMRKLRNKELHNLYSSQNMIRQIKSRRMRWAGHVARVGEERKMYKILVG